MWICSKTMTIKRADKYIVVSPGEPVPEANYWDNAKAWERQGYIRWINRDMPKPQSVSVAVEAKKAEPVLLKEEVVSQSESESENVDVDSEIKPRRRRRTFV